MGVLPQNKSAFLFAAVTSALLIALVLFVRMLAPIPDALYEELFFIVLFFTSALIGVAVYQARQISMSAHTLAKGMANDILVYSRELFSEIYRNSPVPYLLIDVKGDIESINFAAARLFETDIEALHGEGVFGLLRGGDEQKRALIPEYFKSGKFVNDVEVEIVTTKGKMKWVMLSLFSFRDASNAQKGLLTLVDITKQKIVDKAKTEFVSLASHQLRTPISAMKWNIELLTTGTQEKLSELQASYLEKVSHGLERMDMLVTDFLSASKFELGTLTPEYSVVPLGTFLGGVCDEHAYYAEQHGVRIETLWDETLGEIETDTHFLHMITSNLIGNAVKYTRAGGVVRVTALREGEQVTCTVRDTGIGIPEEDQALIFSKMYRATNARSQVTDGTGLGLYIVKEAVEILGGSITFASEEGVGSEFIVRLPISR